MFNTQSPRTDDAGIEQLIQAKGKTAARVTPADLDRQVAKIQYHIFDGSQLTVCCITMTNGFTVTGESACASPENFDQEIGERVAFDNAKQKMWPLLGYALKDRLASI